MNRLLQTIVAIMLFSIPAHGQEVLLLSDELSNLNQPTIISSQMNHSLSGGILNIWGTSTSAGSIFLIWDIDVTGYTDIRAEFTYRRGGSAIQWEQSDWIQMVTLDDANQVIQGSTIWRARPPNSWTVRSSGGVFTDSSRLDTDRYRVGFRARTTQNIEVIQIDSFRVFGTPIPCVADLTDDGELNFFDVSVFLTYFQIGDLAADFTGDGVLNFFDVGDFLIAYGAGCP